jgi:hypothetical protein
VTSVELAIAVKSPIVAIFIIIFCFLPTVVASFQYLRMRGMKAIIDQLPPLTREPPSQVAQLSTARLELTEIPA